MLSSCNSGKVVFAWITWLAIYLTGAISGYISVKESTLRVGGWPTCTCMYKCTQLIHKSLRQEKKCKSIKHVPIPVPQKGVDKHS
ncbi:hypothetical protein ACROYT_G005514 [Oculina patagonica]